MENLEGESDGQIEHSTLVNFGGSIKALENGKIGGYLVRYSGPKDPDLTGDYFTADTNFGIHKTFPLHYAHGFDKAIKATQIGIGEVKEDDTGLWFEAQIEAREGYNEMIAELVEAGKLSYSSGAVGNLVEREQKGNGTYWVKTWPIGEASLTPTPAEPRNIVMPVKSISDGLFITREATEPEANTAEADSKSAPIAETELSISHENKVENTEKENVDATPAPQFVGVTADEIKGIIDSKLDAFKESQESTKATEVKVPIQVPVSGASPLVMPKYEMGDSQTKAFAAWLKTGDVGAVKSLITDEQGGREVVSIKASNATDMNVGTAADGGNTVTDDMYGQIIRKRDESSLIGRLPITQFTSSGTVLDVPLDNEADSEFVSTNEASQFDNDAPAIGQLVLTKAKYTKRTLVSYELLQDTSADVMSFVTDRVGIGYGKTLNDLIITEVETNGTEFKVFASTTAIASGELEAVALNNTNAFYVENPAQAAWVMSPATYGNIALLEDTANRRYYPNEAGTASPRELFGSPVIFSNKCEAEGSGNKPVLFGDWSQVALLLDPTLQFMRDPYTRADYGQVRLIWYFRADAGTLQADGIGYGRNITT
jgi:HK97 family phage major capsid protein